MAMSYSVKNAYKKLQSQYVASTTYRVPPVRNLRIAAMQDSTTTRNLVYSYLFVLYIQFCIETGYFPYFFGRLPVFLCAYIGEGRAGAK